VNFFQLTAILKHFDNADFKADTFLLTVALEILFFILLVCHDSTINGVIFFSLVLPITGKKFTKWLRDLTSDFLFNKNQAL
tara:strand:+ start:2834 stop:3076 length:243 start_codon:yes stop_codon:yes gene_type:complete